MKSLPSVMTHQFSEVPKADIPRSSFDRSHGYKTCFDAGRLIPIFVDEALPGDTFNVDMTALARLATPIFPLMDNMKLSTFFFAVPHRLLWDNWERFCGMQTDPGDSTDYTIPTINFTGDIPLNGLSDYFGLPLGTQPADISALPYRAYNLIWNEWFRDQNLQDSLAVNTDNGPDPGGDYGVRRRGKRHDYFTSALPWPQKGDSVDLPLGTSAPIYSNFAGSALPQFAAVNDNEGNPHTLITTHATNVQVAAAAGTAGEVLLADLTNATAATINQLRQAFQVQKLLERDARGGTRYTEVIKAHFGVTSPDARLQRPEYLGGGSSPVNITPVPQTSNTDTGISPQGNLSGFGTSTAHNHGFTKSFTEHCVLMGFVSVSADLTYWQGIDRMWSRQTRYDYYWPALAHLGEQAILNKEIYYEGTSVDNDVFGYQERFAEYRYKQSRVTNLFRSDAAGTLDAWHLAQDFSSLPVLNTTFIQDTPPIDRVIAITTEPHFIFDSYFKMRCARPMPLYGVPGFVDRF